MRISLLFGEERVTQHILEFLRTTTVGNMGYHDVDYGVQERPGEDDSESEDESSEDD